MKRPDLDEALDMVTVQPVDPMGENSLNGWHSVARDEDGGIIAYFAQESDALRFRLAEVNRILNG